MVEKAYLWWTVSYESGSSLTPTLSLTNPNSIVASYTPTMIGSGGDKCWSEVGTRVFRADVTNSITGSGNYIINVTGNAADEIDGASLFIIYRDANSANYSGSLIINDGCITDGNGGASAQTMTNFTACDSTSSAIAFTIASDFQDNVSGGIHPATLNGTTANYTNDFWNFDQVTTKINSGQTTSAFGVDGTSTDCYTWLVMGLYYQTINCITCTPSNFTTSISHTNITCDSLNNGTGTVTPVGGIGPYTYLWSNGDIDSTTTGLAPGIYTVITKDAGGCTKTNTIAVSDAAFIINVSPAGTINLCKNDSITLVASGGVSYVWNTGDTSATIITAPSVTTIYSVTGTDNTGCSGTASITITVDNCNSIGTSPIDASSEISVYPNPSNGQIWVSIPSGQVAVAGGSGSNTQYEIEIYNVMGEKIYHSIIPARTTVQSGGNNHSSIINLNAPEGGYFLNIKTNNKQFTHKLIINK